MTKAFGQKAYENLNGIGVKPLYKGLRRVLDRSAHRFRCGNCDTERGSTACSTVEGFDRLAVRRRDSATRFDRRLRRLSFGFGGSPVTYSTCLA
jgi:hypothetical protein